MLDLAMSLDLANEILVDVIQAEALNVLVWFSLDSSISTICRNENMPGKLLLRAFDLNPICSLKLN